MKCPICKGQAFCQWGRVDSYSILKCERCGLGITSPFPSMQDLVKTNIEIYEVNQRVQTYLSRKVNFEKRYLQYIRKIKLFRKTGKLLDVGCSIGLFLNVARQEGFETTGVELNNECADYGKRHFKLNIYSDYLENLGFPDNSFDVITLFDVLEHIPNLEGFISEIRRIMKSEGLLVLQSPNIDSIMARLTKSKWSWLTPPDHLYHFTPDSMIQLLNSSGFITRKVRTWEPCKEFYDNLVSVFRSKSILNRALLKFFRVTKIHLLVILILQKLWWRKLKGGLIEIYAIKSSEVK